MFSTLVAVVTITTFVSSFASFRQHRVAQRANERVDTLMGSLIGSDDLHRMHQIDRRLRIATHHEEGRWQDTVRAYIEKSVEEDIDPSLSADSARVCALADLAGRFPGHIVAAVDAITRRARPDGSKEGYFGEYLPRVLAVHLAAVAKRVDASCNLAQCVIEGNDSMAGRYRKVIAAVDTAYPDIARRCAASRHTGT